MILATLDDWYLQKGKDIKRKTNVPCTEGKTPPQRGESCWNKILEKF